MTGVLIIDGEGAVHDHCSSALWFALGCEPIGADVLVRTLGFVAVDMRRRVPRVSLRPDIVERLALGGLTRLLMNGRISRMLLCVDGGSDVDELCPTIDVALGRISVMMTETHRRRIAAFQETTITGEKLPAHSPFAALIQQCRQQGNRVELDHLMSIMDQAFERRFLMLEHIIPSNRLVFRRLGPGYSIFERRWTRIAHGEQFEDQYDAHYGEWAAQGYRAASTRMTPLIQQIDAVIDKPKRGLSRERYARVIVPIEAEGRRLLLSASTTNLALLRSPE